MFLDREITPELEEELRSQQFIIAHNKHEAFEKAKEFKDGFGFPGDPEASMLDHILRRWKGFDTPWSVLKGMRVLDLASGSGYSRDLFGVFYPHFSRFCVINGADVVAVDANPQRGLDETLFTWVEADLVDIVLGHGLKSISAVQGKKFDLIHSSNFVGHNYCPELPEQLAWRGFRRKEFEEVLSHQVGELLAEGGVMYLGEMNEKHIPSLYTRRGSDIIQLPEINRNS